MSRRHFQSSLPRNFVELDIDPSRLAGSGNADYPQLFWQMQMPLDTPKTPQTDYAFRTANAQLYFATGPGQKIADARPLSLNRVIPGHLNHSITEHLNFEFPLATRRIAAIERVRQGGSLQFNLHVQVVVDEIGFVPAHEPSKRPLIWGLKAAHQMSMQERFDVPQSHWVERVLPNIGFGIVHVVEFPAASVESCAALEHSFKALKQAEEQHRLGFYDKAAGKCRVALDKFFDYVPVDPTHPASKKIPVFKKSWESKLGPPTYEWLKATLGTIKDASNPPHHSPNAHFSQFDSQMIIAVTTAVVAYIARTVPPEDLKS